MNTSVKTMRAFAILLLLNLLSGQSLLAQSPAAQNPDDVVRINTNLVQLRVVVTDKAGKPVDNLKQEDFEVFENGQAQNISLFSLDRVAGENAAPDEQKAAVGEKKIIAVSRPAARSIVLFVDSLHMSIASLTRSKRQLKQFIDQQMTDQDLVAIVTTSGSLGVLGQFMRDRVRLKNAIDRITRLSEPVSFFSPYLAARVLDDAPGAVDAATRILTQEEGDPEVAPTPEMVRGRAREIISFAGLTRKATFQMLKAVCERMSELPGQRMIAFVSDGFTMLDLGGGADFQDFHAATNRAIRSGVVIYSFGAEGLTTPPEATARVSSNLSDPRNAGFANYMADTRTDQQNTLRDLASATAGEAFVNSNDLNSQFKKMLTANQLYYALGYYPADQAGKKFRNIKVRLKDHPDYKVRTQTGYQPLDEKLEKAAATPQERLLQAMLKPLPVTTIPVASSASFLRRAGDDSQLTVQVVFSGRSLEYPKQQDNYQLKCEVATVFIDQSGKIAKSVAETLSTALTPQQLESARTRGFRYTKRLDVVPGLYQVRVGVRDANSSAMGTSMSWIEVPKLSPNKLALSSIFLGKESEAAPQQNSKEAAKASRPALVVGPASFKKGEPVFYRFVLYNALTGGPDLMFKVEILDSGKSVYEGDWQPLGPRVVRKDEIGLEIGGQLLMNLEPGVYTLRISVKDSKSKHTSQQTAELELE
jgi:VWFA-related protein